MDVINPKIENDPEVIESITAAVELTRAYMLKVKTASYAECIAFMFGLANAWATAAHVLSETVKRENGGNSNG